MIIDRKIFVESLRAYLGTKFCHQGRDPKKHGLDCGGLVLIGARKHGLSELEFLGYADFPTEGKFEELLEEHTDFAGEYRWPFRFDGTEMRPGDVVSFDYGNGEGTRHIAFVTKWTGRRYNVLEAQPTFGVCEHALAHPFVQPKTVLKVWNVRGLVN